jgi:hypothetical protein
MLRDLGLMAIFFLLGWKAGDQIVEKMTGFAKSVSDEIKKQQDS